jgi:hypothetical protein
LTEFVKKHQYLWYHTSIIRCTVEYIFIIYLLYIIDVITLFYKVNQIFKRILAATILEIDLYLESHEYAHSNFSAQSNASVRLSLQRVWWPLPLISQRSLCCAVVCTCHSVSLSPNNPRNSWWPQGYRGQVNTQQH